MMFRPSSLRFYLATLLAVCTFSVQASEDETAPFVGKFSGRTVSYPSGLLKPHYADIRIKQTSNGSLIDWHSAVTAGRAPECLSYEVWCERSPAPRVYRAHCSSNVVGSVRAPDPISGRSYYRARLSGGGLIVYVMQIMGNGSVDLRIHERHLSGEKMGPRFTRLRDGQRTQSASGTLARELR